MSSAAKSASRSAPTSNGRSREGSSSSQPSRNGSSTDARRSEDSKRHGSDRAKQRKEYTRRVLEDQKAQQARKKLHKPSEFLCKMAFTNMLPEVPCDPKLLKYPFENVRYAKYQPTMLETNYQWQLHIEPDVPIRLPIDLINPENYEVPRPRPPLPPEDDILLNVSDKSNRESSKKPKRRMDELRPNVNWLRRTEYMSNDLWDSVHKYKAEIEIQEEQRKKIANELERIRSVDKLRDIESSFAEMAKNKFVHSTKPSLKAEKVFSVFPDWDLCNTYTIVGFDSHPADEFSIEGDGLFSGDENPQEAKKRRVEKALIRNVKRADPSGLSQKLLGSMLVPSASQEDEDKTKFQFIRDYQVIVKNFQTEDNMVFIVDEDSGEVNFVDLAARIDLKKTKEIPDNSRQRGVLATKRPLDEIEQGDLSDRLRRLDPSEVGPALSHPLLASVARTSSPVPPASPASDAGKENGSSSPSPPKEGSPQARPLPSSPPPSVTNKDESDSDGDSSGPPPTP